MQFRYTDEMLVFLETEFKCIPVAELTDAFNKKYGTNKKKTAIHGLLTRKGFTCGRSGHFVKGQKSWNQGRKGYMGANKTSFKKGTVPPNIKPIGSERIDSKDGYLLVKVAQKCQYTGRDTCYRMKHIVEYEKVYGLVPDGHVVRFKDNDRMNCSPENLELVSKSENLYLNRNGYTDLPEILKPAMKAVARVDIKAAELGRS